MAKEFKLPELGENIESADILNVLVKVGDKVEIDQSVIEIETKLMELNKVAPKPEAKGV